MAGPDCILPTESLTSTDPDGCVKIRDHDSQDLIDNPPISVITLMENTLKQHKDNLGKTKIQKTYL